MPTNPTETDAPIRVLILDDNRDLAENLAEILRGPDVQVRLAGTLREGVEAADAFRPHVVYVDLRLPDGDGHQFVAHLDRRHPQALGIVLTADATIQAAVRAVNAGAFGFVLKDMPTEAILASFNRARERVTLGRQKRELEKKLRHQEQLALIGQMSATLAHEIRNPLTGIAQALDVLLDAVSEDDAIAGMKESIRRRFRHMNELVEELLQFSKTLTIKRTPCDLARLVFDVEAEMRDEGQLKSVTVEVDVAAGAETAEVDAVHFRSLVRNLLRNAAQALDSRDAGAIRVRARAEDRIILIEVEDTGPGIGDAGRIFEPFYTSRTRGTGLGLPLVRRIVEAHGGRVEARNVPGSGACFSLVLPHSSPGAEEPA